MRAFDIAVFLIILQASIGFSNTMGLWGDNYYGTKNDTYDSYTAYRITDLNSSSLPHSDDIIDQGIKSATTAADWIINGFIGIFKILFAVFFIYNELVSTFGIPAGISAVMQMIIYLFYVAGWHQWRSNKGVDSFR